MECEDPPAWTRDTEYLMLTSAQFVRGLNPRAFETCSASVSPLPLLERYEALGLAARSTDTIHGISRPGLSGFQYADWRTAGRPQFRKSNGALTLPHGAIIL